MIDKKKLAIIHIVKKELKLSEPEYRNILTQAAGVTSAKDLDERGFSKLMNFFVRSRYYLVNIHGLTIKQKLFIKYLTKELNWTDKHFKNFLHKYYRKPDIDNLTRREAIKVIESLKNIIKHKNFSKSAA